ncbi:hypothetical protein ACLKA7_013078 [Drosophila subpalustris]
MSVVCRILLLGCLLLTALSAARRARYMVVWHSFDCSSHWAVYTNFTCRIGPEDMEKLNINITSMEPMSEMLCRYKVLVPRPTQNTEMVLFDSTFDVCQLLREGVLKNKLALTVYHNLIRDSNLSKQCPLNQGLIYFRNISVMDGFPAFLPETVFTLNIIIYMPNTTDRLDVNLKGSIVESNRARRKQLALNL